MVGRGGSSWFEGELGGGLRGRFDVVEGGASTWWFRGVLRWFDAWLKGALRRGWRGRFDVV